MPGLDNMNLPVAFSSHLKPDEQLKHWAYGVKQSLGLLLAIVLFAGGILIFLFVGVIGYRFNPNDNPFGAVPIAIITGLVLIPFISLAQKEYIIGITDKRLMVIRIKKSIFTKSVANARKVDFTEYLF
jgi:hypothetical protein